MDNNFLQRYSRHLLLPEVGREGQLLFQRAKILVIGAGGLGCPVLQYLAAAGIGHIGIVDDDVVDITNLQRQVLYSLQDVGLPKVQVAKKKLELFNNQIDIQTYPVRLTSANVMDIIQGYDIVVDGTDNFPARYLINDACVLADKVCVYGSIFRFDGQVSVFNGKTSNGRGPNYRDLFPTPPPPELVPNCAEAGVLGILPGIIGCYQANEVVKIILELGDPLIGRLLLFNALTAETQIIKFDANENNRIEGLIDYQEFCGLKSETIHVPEISVSEFQHWRIIGKTFQLLDIREPHEFDIVNLEGILIPSSTIEERIDEISDDDVIVHCRTGVRSARVVKHLRKYLNRDNIFNLKGGILAYVKEIDPSLPTY